MIRKLFQAISWKMTLITLRQLNQYFGMIELISTAHDDLIKRTVMVQGSAIKLIEFYALNGSRLPMLQFPFLEGVDGKAEESAKGLKSKY